MSAAPVYRFPFGNPLRKVEQKERSPKKVFVLGVYASAVHATWRDAAGKVLVRALAVASEPEIFWDGRPDEAARIISKINKNIPASFGTLGIPATQYNGPSGRALDELILKPLGYGREHAWLCDCIPYSRVNPSQVKAIKNHYTSLVAKGLPEATIPNVEKGIDDRRRAEILAELEESQAKLMILLGDLPITWFLSHYVDGWTNLDAFVREHGYGTSVKVKINDCSYDVLPLVHPRQAGKLGVSSGRWIERHQDWLKGDAR